MKKIHVIKRFKRVPSEAIICFIGILFVIIDPFSFLSRYNMASNIAIKLLMSFTVLYILGAVSAENGHLSIFNDENGKVTNVGKGLKFVAVFLVFICVYIIYLTY